MGKRILLIDNNTQSLKKLFNYLLVQGYSITRTDCAENALKVLQQYEYALIVTQSTLLDADIIQLDEMLHEINYQGRILPVINDPLLKKAIKDLYHVQYYIENPDDLVKNEEIINTLLQLSELEDFENQSAWWDAHYHIRIPSASELIDKVIRFLAEKASTILNDSRKLHAFRMATSEALANAIEHGNGFHLLKQVDIQMDVSQSGVEVTIRDEGNGFDHRKVQKNFYTLNQTFQTRGRGLSIIQKYCDRMEIKGNGNTITFCILREREASTKDEKQSA